MQRRSLGIYNWYVILDSILASKVFLFFVFICFTHMLKYSKDLDSIKSMKYFFSHVHVKYNTLVTGNSNPPLQSQAFD